eukprot:scaffold8802_cov142-Amphora_coffeaeformis.AAC.2
MNDASDCHVIPDVPGVFVDAFRGSYMAQKTKVAANIFILSHYHGDHYGSLPREGNYQGPAQIHCTEITAALLVRVHGVSEHLVVAHPLGETWTIVTSGDGDANSKELTTTTQITFYDANHCPGAAIILFHASNGNVHLHTGDMRYHERMKSFPFLREAALNRRIDVVLLDTTYAHPKHSFLPQGEAVNFIATQACELLQPNQPKTLVLLSCYSIGKEKVLWEVVQRTGQKIYANERKRRMLECIQTASDETTDPSLGIIDHCTDDPALSDVHVISMGLAGRIWPFFQPDYKSCLEYARKQKGDYKRVVAFLPTGWADASNWNKKNACKTIVKDGVTVSVRLVAYSEHSTFDELQSMVDFLQPRQVIPTVYSDEKDRLKIQARFRIDTKRAKQAFFDSMTTLVTKSVIKHGEKKQEYELEDGAGDRLDLIGLARKDTSLSMSPSSNKEDEVQAVDLVSGTDSEEESSPSSRTGTGMKRCCTNSKDPDNKRVKQVDVETLVSMGFPRNVADEALNSTGADLNAAIEQLLQQPYSPASKPQATPIEKSATKVRKIAPTHTSGMQSIKKFFSPAKKP